MQGIIKIPQLNKNKFNNTLKTRKKEGEIKREFETRQSKERRTYNKKTRSEVYAHKVNVNK